MTIYGLLALAVMWGFGPGREGAFVKVAVETVLFCLVYGMTDEFHQSFIPRRSVSGLDLLTDLAGAMLVCGRLMNGNFRVFVESLQATLAKRLEGDYIEIKYKNESS